MFTVLFSDDDKEDILENIFTNNKIINTPNYKEIRTNYQRALLHLKKDKEISQEKVIIQVDCSIKQGNQKYEIEEISQEKVIIQVDCSIKQGNQKYEIEDCTVKEAKKYIYEKLGISISKQEIVKEEEVLNNGRYLKNETVIVRQKRRTNKTKH
ncbi:ubiquitin-like superfamily protein [Vairimorpha necatrix]|uniref:Ubiquitin-like superfamily protein n=1 Tax=Vairimorpha necatrix TaxID=6039 RepID=A0AAX4J983_9MICR